MPPINLHPSCRFFRQGYDDIPEKIPDADAKKPEDWDDEDDGEWEPPLISNPDYKGPWTQKQVANPDYKGIWEAPDIPNPEFKDDPMLYAFKDLANVGFELWQVKAGSLFDNILVTDDRAYAKEFAEKTWGANKEAEKTMFDEVKKVEQAKEEARVRKKRRLALSPQHSRVTAAPAWRPEQDALLALISALLGS